MTAEVRTDKGKFVNTAWSVDIDGEEWWVVIGFEATMKTVIRASPGKLGLGDDIVRSGELYDFVARVNTQLMADEPVDSRGLSSHPHGGGPRAADGT
jgi:hypothetical protein